MGNFEDLTGKTFGRLTVLYRTHDDNIANSPQWLCECSCEEHNRIIVTSGNLKNGGTQSCGCLRRELLIKFNKEIGIKAGICVEFREVKECYYIPINTIEKYKLLHYKSITNDMCKEDRSIILIPTVYKQVNCKIIKSKFDEELHEVRI